MGNLCCAREHSVQFFVQFFKHLNCTVQRRVYGAIKGDVTYLRKYTNMVNFIVCIYL